MPFIINKEITMLRKISLFVTTILLFSFHSAYSEESVNDSQSKKQSLNVDFRQLVEMPDQARQFLMTDMLSHLSALNEIIGYLAVNNLDAVADVAEARMGKSTMGKHRGTGMGPGRFMPLEMRKIGWGLHESATELSIAAKKGDIKSTYSALQKVTTACVGCHYSYRTQ